MPGLYLQVTKRKSNNGVKAAKTKSAKSWLLRYELHGKEHMLGLGSAAIFNLKEARERARSARQLIADGTDPLQTKHATKAAAKAAAAKALTFREAAERYFDQHQAEWTNDSHRDQFLASLKSHAFPAIGGMDVAAIDKADVLRVISPQWTTKSVTMDRVRNRIEAVLDWAVVLDHRPPGTNPARWRGHLDQVLPAVRKVAPVKHHPALDYKLLPAFMADLREREGSAARGLEFMIMTAARTGEVTGAVWDEIDLDNAMWTIPAERMKKTGRTGQRREHRVPLSPAAVKLLRNLPGEDDNPFVFIGPQPGEGLSKMAFTRVMDLLEHRDITVHGFRSSFSDWANEETRHSNHTIEISLSHKVGNEVERAYRRKDMFAKRVRLMADWSKYCASPPAATKGKTDNVVSINEARQR